MLVYFNISLYLVDYKINKKKLKFTITIHYYKTLSLVDSQKKN